MPKVRLHVKLVLVKAAQVFRCQAHVAEKEKLKEGEVLHPKVEKRRGHGSPSTCGLGGGGRAIRTWHRQLGRRARARPGGRPAPATAHHTSPPAPPPSSPSQPPGVCARRPGPGPAVAAAAAACRRRSAPSTDPVAARRDPPLAPLPPGTAMASAPMRGARADAARPRPRRGTGRALLAPLTVVPGRA